MDESLQDLETELKELAPLWPSHQLVDRIALDLAADPKTSANDSRTAPVSQALFGWRVVGLAAALAVVGALAIIGLRQSEPATSARLPSVVAKTVTPSQPKPEIPTVIERPQPVVAANILYDLKDEGPAKGEGDASARRVRYRYLDTYTWKNPRGNASLRVSVPRDEIRIVPVSLN